MATLTVDTRQTSLLDVPARERSAPREPAPARERSAPREPATALERSAQPAPAASGAAATASAAPAALAGPTLDDLVTRTWSALRVARSAACILCGGEVAPRYGSGPHPVGGACRSCGTELG